MENIYLERRHEALSIKLKISQIEFISMEKSTSEVRERKLLSMIEKIMKIYEIHLI